MKLTPVPTRISDVSSSPTTADRIRQKTGRVLGVALDLVLMVLGALLSMLSIAGVSVIEYSRNRLAGTDPFGAPGSEAGTMLILGVIGSLACWATFWWRRTRPGLVLVAGIILTVLIQLDYLLLAVGLSYWIARDTSPRRKLGIAAGISAMVLVIVRNCLRSPNSSEVGLLVAKDLPSRSLIVTVSLTFGIAILAASITTGMAGLARREKTQAQRRADAASARNTTLSQELQGLAQREDLAREMHDSLASRLAMMSLRTKHLSDSLDANSPDQVRAATELRTLADQSLADLRSLLEKVKEQGIVQSNQPPISPTSAGPSLGQIPDLIEEAKACGLEITDRVLLTTPERIAPELGLAAYRIAQESLTNAMKHGAGPVSVTLIGGPTTGLVVDVRNPLVEDLSQDRSGSGSGLVGMKARVEAWGGQFFANRAGSEFIVTATLPWRDNEP